MALNLTLRKTFLYIFASVGLVLCIIGSVSLLNIGLKTYVFTKADYCYNYATPILDKNGNNTEPTQAQRDEQLKQCKEQNAASKQNSASWAIAQLIIGIPLYLWSWRTIKKEHQV
jgi:hypothetical protein